MVKDLIGYQYLDKFFDLQFSLRDINIENYMRSLGVIDTLSGGYFETCAKEICMQFKFSLRQMNRFFNLISLIYDYINFKENMHDAVLSKYILFPIMLGIKIYDINIYNKIINGEGENELKSIIMNNTEIINVFNHFFNVEHNEKELAFDFSELYKSLFIDMQESEWVDVRIGNRDIKYGKERKRLKSLLSFLNEFVKL